MKFKSSIARFCVSGGTLAMLVSALVAGGWFGVANLQAQTDPPPVNPPQTTQAESKIPKASGSQEEQAPDPRFQIPDTDDVATLKKFAAQLAETNVGTREEFVQRKAAMLAVARRIVGLTRPQKNAAYFEAMQELLLLEWGGRYDPDFSKQLLAYLKEKNQLDATDLHLLQRSMLYVPQESQAAVAQQVIQTLRAIENRFSEAAVEKVISQLEGMLRFNQLVGQEMKLIATDTQGEAFDLKDLQGKVVLVDFWATWCQPCLAEHEKLEQVFAKYADHGFEIVGISLDRDRQQLDSFLEEHEVAWTTLYADGGQSEAAEFYGIQSIPLMILIGRDGKVISNSANKDLERRLSELFPEVKDGQ